MWVIVTEKGDIIAYTSSHGRRLQENDTLLKVKKSESYTSPRRKEENDFSVGDLIHFLR